MTILDTFVSAHIDSDTKERASEALEAMGLPVVDAILILMLRITDKRHLPFEIEAPNTTTRKAIADLEADKGKRPAKGPDTDLLPVLLAIKS